MPSPRRCARGLVLAASFWTIQISGPTATFNGILSSTPKSGFLSIRQSLCGAHLRRLPATGGCARILSQRRPNVRTVREAKRRGRGPPKRKINGTRCDIVAPPSFRSSVKLPPAYKVLAAWDPEIDKPDFNDWHMAQAIKHLQNMDYSFLRRTGKIRLEKLMNRSVEILQTKPIKAGRLAAMLRNLGRVEARLPVSIDKLAASVGELIINRLGELKTSELPKVILGATALRHTVPLLFEQLPSQIDALHSDAKELSAQQLSLLISAVCNFPSDAPGVNATLAKLQESLAVKIDDLNYALPMLADMMWDISLHGFVEDSFKARLVIHVTRQTRHWVAKKIDPDMYRILCAFAKLGIDAPTVHKGVARRALQEGLDGLSGWSLASLAWSLEQLAENSSGLDVFRKKLSVELKLRSLSGDDVALSRLGPDGGGDDKLAAFWKEQQPRRKEKVLLLAQFPAFRRLPMMREERRKQLPEPPADPEDWEHLVPYSPQQPDDVVQGPHY